MLFFRQTQSGNATTREACDGWCVTAPTHRWRACSCTQLERFRQTLKAPTEREARQKRFFIDGWKPSPKRRAFSGSTSICLSRSTVSSRCLTVTQRPQDGIEREVLGRVTP